MKLLRQIWLDTMAIPFFKKLYLLIMVAQGVIYAPTVPYVAWFVGVYTGAAWFNEIHMRYARAHIDLAMELFGDMKKLQLENETLKTKLGEQP